jgi:hypothetical protein
MLERKSLFYITRFRFLKKYLHKRAASYSMATIQDDKKKQVALFSFFLFFLNQKV